MNFNTICILGLGYIGLPTAGVFSARGFNVIGVDVDESVISTINSGQIHIREPELEAVIDSAVRSGLLRATHTPVRADAFVIAVPTPLIDDARSQPSPDTSFVHEAANAIAPVLEQGNLIILESTCPVGTTEELADILTGLRPDLDFPKPGEEKAQISIAHCPERVLPGRIMRELVENDRIIGGLTPDCTDRATELYQTVVSGRCIRTTARTAEMAKLTENSFRDVNIAFANELSMICAEHGIDVWQLIELANRHPRVNILQPGPGVGGHCIAIDPWFIVSQSPELARVIRTAREVNNAKPHWVVEQIQKEIGAILQKNPESSAGDITLACYGLTFKPDVDDLRESPAVQIVHQIALHHPGTVSVLEPNIHSLPPLLKTLGNVQLIHTEPAAAHVHVLLVDHTAFRSMPAPQGAVVDTRGFWS